MLAARGLGRGGQVAHVGGDVIVVRTLEVCVVAVTPGILKRSSVRLGGFRGETEVRLDLEPGLTRRGLRH